MGMTEHTLAQVILRPRHHALLRPRQWRLAEKLDCLLKLVLLYVVDEIDRQQRRLHRLVLSPQPRIRLLDHARHDLAVVALEELLPDMLPQLQLLKKIGRGRNGQRGGGGCDSLVLCRVLCSFLGRILSHTTSRQPQIAIATHYGLDVSLAERGRVRPVVEGARARRCLLLALASILLLLLDFKYLLESFEVRSSVASKEVVANDFVKLAVSLNFQLRRCQAVLL